eukprot:CAMPEP_0197198738 /NCGR_PEP_ID=MMETSP1423-20130617/33524_1 /TAXON_ID=476441 /ORGANISM="Pseudo-nitzschia heimii, Strain UNC1101" /LENGTH=491 /DNA_ID=CAMNT_0042652575 /DNA_START=80 /DNA_END=1552 /DNA_ORIENTATION=-
MTNTCVLCGRKTSAVVVFTLLLLCGTLPVVVDAFQSTYSSVAKTKNPSLQSPGDVHGARMLPRNRHSRGIIDYGRFQRGREGRLFGGVAVASMNGTSPDAFGDYATPQPHEEHRAPSVPSSGEGRENAFLPRGFFSSTVAKRIGGRKERVSTVTTTRGRTRQAIRKMRDKYLSLPVESRRARVLSVPVKLFVQKPLSVAKGIFTNHLDGHDTVVLDTDAGSGIDHSSHETENLVSATPHVVVEIATSHEPSLVEVKQEEVVDSETILETSSEVRAEPVHHVPPPPPPSVVIHETATETVEEETGTVAISSAEVPPGDRWAVAAPGIDLSGKWELIVTEGFKKDYDRYLERLGQPRLVRSVALSGPVIGQTMEEVFQIDDGRSLRIRGKNVRGTWDRTLVASGATTEAHRFEPLVATISTVDQELVDAEAWWEDEGTAHVSWMRGVTMYGGGSFYSRRYLEDKEREDDETVYVCEGYFRFNDPAKEDNELTW